MGRTGFAMHASPVTTRPRPQQTQTSSASAAAADAPGVRRKLVYSFGGGSAEGTAGMKDVLGGKGANLAEMTNLGVPVPPGFTIATSVCNEFLSTGKEPAGLEEEVETHL